jgi:hypothetical protein
MNLQVIAVACLAGGVLWTVWPHVASFANTIAAEFSKPAPATELTARDLVEAIPTKATARRLTLNAYDACVVACPAACESLRAALAKMEGPVVDAKA